MRSDSFRLDNRQARSQYNLGGRSLLKKVPPGAHWVAWSWCVFRWHLFFPSGRNRRLFLAGPWGERCDLDAEAPGSGPLAAEDKDAVSPFYQAAPNDFRIRGEGAARETVELINGLLVDGNDKRSAGAEQQEGGACAWRIHLSVCEGAEVGRRDQVIAGGALVALWPFEVIEVDATG